LIPALFLSTLINKKRVRPVEYLLAIFISLGLVCFSVADATVYPDMNPLGKKTATDDGRVCISYYIRPCFTGIGLALVSVVADAFLPTFQEHVFAHGASRIEVSFYSNIVSLVMLTLAGPILSHESIGEHIRFVLSSFRMLLLLSFYALLSYGAITVHMQMVKTYGGIATVLVGNTRKALTILMSFLLFPKPWSPLYLVGCVLVFGGLVGHAYVKESSGRASSTQKSADALSPPVPSSPRLDASKSQMARIPFDSNSSSGGNT
jgi:adenosine 3'-phospho 5'-phosphosulfate transporter B3